MIPLIILLTISGLAWLIEYLRRGGGDLGTSARVGMSAMLLFTAVGHFLFPDGMALMIPDPIPFKEALVLITAFLEFLAAIGLQVPRYRKITGWLLILFFVAVLPANIYASVHEINYKTGAFDGPGITYLWFRVPLQVLFIIWTYFSTIKKIPK